MNPENLNNYFVTTAHKTLQSSAEPTEQLIDSLPDTHLNKNNVFYLKPVSYEEIVRTIKCLRSDSLKWSGPDTSKICEINCQSFSWSIDEHYQYLH